MKSVPWLACGVIAGSAMACAAWAQPASPPAIAAQKVSLPVAIDAAWQRALSAREVDGQRRRAQAEQTAAGSLWAAPPSLWLGYRDDRIDANKSARETEVALSWPLWLPGQRSARAAAAGAEMNLADSSGRAARWRIAGEVREAAWVLTAHQADLDQASAHAASLQALAADVERRVRAGDLARADALAARAETLAATAQQAEARQRLLATSSRWTLLTGLQALPEISETSAAASVTLNPDHPELQQAGQAIDYARKRVERVKTSHRDPPELALRVISETPGRPDGAQTSFGVALKLPFGTDDRNLPLQAAALTELDLAETQERRLRERLESDLASAQAAVLSAETQEAAERARATLLRERAQLIDKSFRAGESPLPELLRALAASAQADASLARQTAALGLARARLQQASGLLP